MRIKSIILNFVSDVLPQIIIAIISLFRTKIFLFNLGMDVTGLYQYFGQVMTYLALMDGGLSSAINCRLYKPIAEKNYKKINQILSAANVIFIFVAVLILIVGFAVSYFIPSMINNNPFSLGYIQMAFMIYLISNVFNYLTVAQKSLFESDQRKYIVNCVFQPVIIVRSLVEIGVLLIGGDLFAILMIQAVFGLLSNILIMILCKRQYSFLNLRSKIKDFSMVKDVSNLMIYKIGSLITYNIDVIIIASKLGLAASALYSAYLLIMDNLTNIIGKLVGATMASIGDILARSKEKAKCIFDEFNSFCFLLIAMISTPLLLVLNNFLTIWYEGKYETTFIISLFFVLNFSYYIAEIPLRVYTNAAGLFKETRFCPLIEATVNLILSLFLVQYMGIPGVLCATFISYILGNYLLKPRIIFHSVFKQRCIAYYVKNLGFIVMIAINFFVLNFIYQAFSVQSLTTWFLSSFLIFGVNSIVVIIEFSMTKQLRFLKRFTILQKYIGFIIK